MSSSYNDTSTNRGLVQSLERKLGFSTGQISGNSSLLSYFTAEFNVALDELYADIFEVSGKWQFDDQNHTDYPIITTALTTGRRDYTFTSDNNSNLLLEIERVFILPSSTATQYVEIFPVDVQSDDESAGIYENNTTQGVPVRYDKTGNGIFLDPIPSYTVAAGLKCYVSREGSYFVVGDTTKKPGFVGLYHDYLALVVAYKYARDKDMKNVARLERDMLIMQRNIKKYYAKRAKDERSILTGKKINYI